MTEKNIKHSEISPEQAVGYKKESRVIKLMNGIAFYGIFLVLFWIISFLLLQIVYERGTYIAVTTTFYSVILVYAFRDKVKSLMLGAKYCNYVIIETGEVGKCTLNNDRTITKINSKLRSINKLNIVDRTVFLSTELAENLKVEYDNAKAKFYMNSDEFDKIVQNKLLAQMLYVKAKDLVKIAIILTLFAVLIGAVSLYYQNQQYNNIMSFIATIPGVGTGAKP